MHNVELRIHSTFVYLEFHSLILHSHIRNLLIHLITKGWDMGNRMVGCWIFRPIWDGINIGVPYILPISSA